MPTYRFAYQSVCFYERLVVADSPVRAKEIAFDEDDGNWECVHEEHGATEDEFFELNAAGIAHRAFLVARDGTVLAEADRLDAAADAAGPVATSYTLALRDAARRKREEG